MMQCVLHQFPDTEVEFKFKCRDKNVDLRPFAEEIGNQIGKLGELYFWDYELNYLSKLRFFKKDFIAFLKFFRLDPSYVSIDASGEELEIRVKGPWLHTILFEVPILAIVNEIYNSHMHDTNAMQLIGTARLEDKIESLKFAPSKFKFSEFGTRRRFSYEWQEKVVKQLAEKAPAYLSGTSNVLLAMANNLTPIGTMAHEFLQAGQAVGPRLRDSQKFMLEKWVQEYRGDLGIALTDVINLDSFLLDFDLYFAKLYDGLRHDSGDPYEFGDKVIKHYKKMKIDPRSKTIVFSDGLDLKKAFAIHDCFADDINVAFGIGTNLTNDMGSKSLNVVIKMVKCNGQHVAKISDSPGKGMCENDDYVKYLKSVFGVV